MKTPNPVHTPTVTTGSVELVTTASGGRRKHLALVAMLFAVSMTFIDQTIVAIASPAIQDQLDLSRTGSQWVVNAYLLALAATFALGGRMADVMGPRRMVVLGITGFAVTSALCGATPHGSMAGVWIITFRLLQGFSGAVMIPAALAVVVAAFPVTERGRALAVFFGVSGALTSVGPIAGGFLTQWTWRGIFWINVPIAVLALIITACAQIPSTRRPERIDGRGAALVAVGMGMSVIGFQEAQTWGWTSLATWGCILGGVVVLLVFAVVELRTASPLIQVRIFTDREFVIDNIVLFLAMVAFVPVFFFASLYAQASLGYDANQAGLYLLVLFCGFAPAAQVGGRMLDRDGARRPMILGSALAAAGFALWASRLHEYSLGAQWPFIMMAGAGIGLLLGPASTDAVNRSIDASYGEVTGITQTVRNYAASLGLAVLGTVLTTVLTERLTGSLIDFGVPRGQAAAVAHDAARGGVDSSSILSPTLAEHLHAAVARDFATASQAVFYGMAIALAVCFVAALSYPRRSL
ncbi:MFS transporter [Nocardioides sp.]|uniref:MFS transporter n=1 Tax=Nocardioides sp. TaxID=35761 RepID=UPI003784FBD8